MCSHDSCIFNEIIQNMSKIYRVCQNPDQISDVILSDVVSPNDSLISGEILIKCEEQVLNELKPKYSFYGVASCVTCPYNGFISSLIINECNKYVPNESNSSHIFYAVVSSVGKFHK